MLAGTAACSAHEPEGPEDGHHVLDEFPDLIHAPVVLGLLPEELRGV